MGSPPPAMMDRLVGSPCCLPQMPLDELLSVYQNIGFKQLEAFSSWAKARHDWNSDPKAAAKQAQSYGMAITSYHLPPISEDLEGSLAQAIAAATFASQLGDNVAVLFKANSLDLFAKAGRRFLDTLEQRALTVIPVIQNHKGSAITTLDDYGEALARINDERMKCVLEVGHFQRVGVSWEQGWSLLENRIALIHINDIRAGKSVRLGEGEVDFSGLLKRIKERANPSNIVVELELANQNENPDETIAGLTHAVSQLIQLYESA